jgi:hypothetical protein
MISFIKLNAPRKLEVIYPAALFVALQFSGNTRACAREGCRQT